MNYDKKSKDELIKELQELQLAHNSLKASFDKNSTETTRLSEKVDELQWMIEHAGDAAIYRGNYNTMQYEFWTPNVEQVLGYTAKEMYAMGQPGAVKLINPDDLTKLNILLGDLMAKGGGPYSIQYCFTAKDGNVRNISESGHAFVDKNNVPQYAIGSIRDITDRKQTEKMFQDIIEKNPMAIQILDMEGCTIQINSAFKKIFGIAPPSNYSIFKDKQLLKQGLAEAFEKIKKGEVIEFPNSYYNAHDVDPSFPDVALWLKVIGFSLNVNSEMPGKIVLMHENITERKQTEESLRASESLYRKMIENSSLGMHFYTLNSNNQLIFVNANPAASEILGVNNSQFIGKTIEDAFPPLKDTEVPDRYRNAAEKGIPWTTEQIAYNDGKITGAYEVRAFQTEPGSMVAVFKDITESKQIEVALQESELQFRNLFENAADAIFIAEQESGTIVDANQAAEKLLQMPHNKIIGLNQTKLHPTEIEKFSTETFRKQQKDASELNNISRVENKVVRADGTEVPVEILASEVFYKGKKCLMGTFRDITERKKAEIELLEAKEAAEAINANVTAIIEGTTSSIWAFDRNYNVLYINQLFQREFYQTFGVKLERGVNLIEALPEPLRPFWKPRYDRVLANEQFTVEDAIDTGNGMIYIQVSFNPIVKSGKVIGGSCFGNNITARKLVELELLRAKERAEESEERLQSVFLVAPTGIGLVKDRILYEVNPKICEMTGYSKEELIGKNSLILYPSQEEFDYVGREKYKQIEEKGTGIVETKWKKKSGEIIDVLLASTPFDRMDIKKGVTFTALDITERKRLENDLNIAKERAEESDRLKTAFLQNMSHEIRTPMNAIMGFSSLLPENYNNQKNLEKFSGIINQRCSDLLDIINDILDISKIESGQLAINNEECRIADLFSELNIFFTEYQNRIGKQHINFILQNNTELLFTAFMTDKVKLKQILINLISNAFKFTTSGTIKCGCKVEKNQLIFHVSDTGIGIPQDKFELIFERFTQLHHKAIKNISGTGLGLSIAKGLTDLLGGKIWLESEQDKGTTFYFSIDYKKSTLTVDKQINLINSQDFNFSNKTILIVEDDVYNSAYLKEILVNTGFTIITAEYGKDAVQIATSQPVDLILMDIRLPDMNGYEATTKIKQINPHIKIIAQTAYAAQDEKQKALDAGCIDYISKPTKREILFGLLNKHLALSAG